MQMLTRTTDRAQSLLKCHRELQRQRKTAREAELRRARRREYDRKHYRLRRLREETELRRARRREYDRRRRNASSR